MPNQIKAWKCEHCKRYRITKSAIVKHENICFENPDRKILEGQMAIFSTMPRELLITNSYGVPDSDWEEPDEYPSDKLLNKYKWWPIDEDGFLGLGFIYKKGNWERIDGYIPPNFAPGFSWKNEIVPGRIKQT